MSREITLREEVSDAFKKLRREDQLLINKKRAEEAIALVTMKCTRPIRPIRDAGVAIRNTLAEMHIGAQGLKERRQKIFAAYWRLLRKVLDNREGAQKRLRRVA